MFEMLTVLLPMTPVSVRQVVSGSELAVRFSMVLGPVPTRLVM